MKNFSSLSQKECQQGKRKTGVNTTIFTMTLQYFLFVSLVYFVCIYSAHLWGASAIPLALSIICCTSCVVCVHHSYQKIFSANVHHVPGLCLLGIGGARYVSHKILAQKPYFHIFDFFSETTRRFLKPRPSEFVKIIVKLHLWHFGRTLKMEKCKNWFLFKRPLKTFFSKTT